MMPTRMQPMVLRQALLTLVAPAGLQRRDELEHDHDAQSIQDRLNNGNGHGHLSDAVLGAMDGAITTFAIVAGAVGGGLSGMIVVILGLAKVAADALSMAASNYFGARSRAQEVERARAMERRHIEEAPEGEREEMRQIYKAKGFCGELVEEIVDVYARNPGAWIETMIKEELHLPSKSSHPLKAAAATFAAFLLVGILPLVPFLLGTDDPGQAFHVSIAITVVVFAGIGLVRGALLHQSLWRSGLETLLTGGAAAAVAYGVGFWLRHTLGAV